MFPGGDGDLGDGDLGGDVDLERDCIVDGDCALVSNVCGIVGIVVESTA